MRPLEQELLARENLPCGQHSRITKQRNNEEYWLCFPSISGALLALLCFCPLCSLYSCHSLLLLHSLEWLLIFQVPIQTLILQRSLPWLSDLTHHLLATFSDNTCFYLYKVQLFACCISQTSPEKQKLNIYIFSETETDWFILKNPLKQLLEAEKPPKPVLYKLWRLRKASEVIQSEPKGQKMRTVNDVNPSPRAGKRWGEMSQLHSKAGEKWHILLPYLLFSWTDWMTATHTQEGSVLYCIHWLEC